MLRCNDVGRHGHLARDSAVRMRRAFQKKRLAQQQQRCRCIIVVAMSAGPHCRVRSIRLTFLHHHVCPLKRDQGNFSVCFVQVRGHDCVGPPLIGTAQGNFGGWTKQKKCPELLSYHLTVGATTAYGPMTRNSPRKDAEDRRRLLARVIGSQRHHASRGILRTTCQ